MSRRKTLTLLAIGFGLGLGAALFFVLGLGAARFFPAAPPAPEPKVVLQPGPVNLLPDASLRLDLPPGFDFDAGK